MVVPMNHIPYPWCVVGRGKKSKTTSHEEEDIWKERRIRSRGRRKGGTGRIEFPFLIKKRDHRGCEEKKEREEKKREERRRRKRKEKETEPERGTIFHIHGVVGRNDANDISRRRSTHGIKRRKELDPYSAARRVSQNRFAANPEYHPEGSAVVRGAGEKEDRPESNSPSFSGREITEAVKKRKKGKKKQGKKREKKGNPKGGLIILRKKGRPLSNLDEDIEMKGVRRVKEGEKMSFL
ncbi:hypothetical protein CEXT_699041 [Caerostris extrusa]|uniref:Uncharacterized protein n=1 Tax=Caerostris extrusa TaxID=172846 RepID=A0AAV4VV83_CAEEX|nr:hypothetical protein CEXT_699041 [Caerostris extrusa]